MFRGEFRMLRRIGNLKINFENGLYSRDRFLSGLDKGKPEVVGQGWQKDYMQTAKDKKPLAHPFANEISRAAQNRRNGNHHESANT